MSKRANSRAWRRFAPGVVLGVTAPFLLAAQCENGYVSMGSDAGTAGVAGARSDSDPRYGGAGGTGGGTGGEAPSCDAFLDEAPGTEVLVRITNATDAPLHLGQTERDCSGVQAYYTIRDQSGSHLESARAHCDMACEILQTPSLVGCTAICRFTPLVRLAPGASYELPWDGRFVDHPTMPGACYGHELNRGAQCSRLFVAPESRYVFNAVGWSELVCDYPDGCPCAETDGVCEINTAVPGGESREARAVLEYPAQDFVEIRFE